MLRPRSAVLLLVVFCLAFATACDDDPASDAGPGRDAGERSDAAAREDAGTVADAGARTDAGTTADAGPPRDAGSAPDDVAARARALATHLTGSAHFMMGLGNDLDGETFDANLAGAFTLGADLDLHYVYLVGYGDQGGWPTWNADGAFVSIHAEAARNNGGVTPMFTYYQLALDYETGQDALRDAGRMGQWLTDVALLFTRLGEFDDPAVVHFEPDLFGYLQQRFEMMGTTAADYPMELSGPHCGALPHVAASFGACVAAMRDALAPKVRVALHASQWGAYYDPVDPDANVAGSAASHAAFLRSMGAEELDAIVVETLDRDAGFWEAYGGESGRCSETDGPRGRVYWDETNTVLPHFARHFAWVAGITAALSLPALWWQTPLGAPSDTCGGEDGRWRDNRVRYFFSHVGELIAAGGVGAAFGTGAGRQTYITSDGNQFRDAARAYVASPTPLP